MMSFMESAMPFAVMIMVEIADVGVSTLSKAAMAKGMSNLVFIVYSNALATLLLLPFLLVSCRTKLPPLSSSLILGFFLLGLIGSVGQILAYTGIKFSSPALLSAMANLIPIFTFMLAIGFRMEKLDLKRSSSKAKCLGTVVAVSGASIITLYKGPLLITSSSSSSSSPSSSSEFLKLQETSQQSNWILGGFLFLICSLLSAGWHIAQASFVNKYPEKMVNVFFFTLFVTLQTATFAVVIERNPAVWKLSNNIEMVAVVYSAIFGSVVRIFVHTWCLQKKGPVYVVMFKPLGMVVAVAMVVAFLGEALYFGSVMGSFVIACGFYTVIWGKMNEQNPPASEPESVRGSESPSASLLQHSSSLENAYKNQKSSTARERESERKRISPAQV